MSEDCGIHSSNKCVAHFITPPRNCSNRSTFCNEIVNLSNDMNCGGKRRKKVEKVSDHSFLPATDYETEDNISLSKCVKIN